MPEVTNPQINVDELRRLSAVAEPQLAELEKAIVRRLWDKVPKKAAAWLVAAATILGGGGVALKDYIPVKIESVWETKVDAAAEHAAIRAEIKQLPDELIRRLDERDVRRGHR